jgi:hypothetical protein
MTESKLQREVDNAFDVAYNGSELQPVQTGESKRIGRLSLVLTDPMQIVKPADFCHFQTNADIGQFMIS